MRKQNTLINHDYFFIFFFTCYRFAFERRFKRFLHKFIYLFSFQTPPSDAVCSECSGTNVNGPNGTPEPLSSCDGCGMSLHTTCANIAAKTSIQLTTLVAKGSKWFCVKCKTCEGCNTTEKGGPCLLGCCECNKNYHFECLDPVPNKKTKCPWRFVIIFILCDKFLIIFFVFPKDVDIAWNTMKMFRRKLLVVKLMQLVL